MVQRRVRRDDSGDFTLFTDCDDPFQLGGRQVWTANTTVYLGQPLSPTGGVQLQSLATNPSTVGQIIHSEAALRQAAREAQMPVGKLRGHVSSRPVSGSLTRLGQTPEVLISVTGSAPRHVQVAANGLARIVIAVLRGGGTFEAKAAAA